MAKKLLTYSQIYLATLNRFSVIIILMASTLTPKMRDAVQTDHFFERSCLSGRQGSYGDPIRIHHCLKFAGKQIQLPFNIVPLLDTEHDNQPQSVHRCQETREKVELICLMRASDEEIKKYGLEQKKRYLTKKYFERE